MGLFLTHSFALFAPVSYEQLAVVLLIIFVARFIPEKRRKP
jgi:hypothetical protein